jgi:hypothetical protein
MKQENKKAKKTTTNKQKTKQKTTPRRILHECIYVNQVCDIF